MRHLLLCLLVVTPAWSAELPDDAKALVTAFEKKRHDAEAKASADIAKELEALAKTLRKYEERETKAHRSENALAIKSCLEGLGEVSTTVVTKGNKPFAEFLKQVQVRSQSYQLVGGQTGGGSAVISLPDFSVECKRGLNVVAIVDGQKALQKAYQYKGEFEDFVKDIDALPQGAYVVMAVRDTFPSDLPESCNKSFFAVGAKEGLVGKTANSTGYLLIGAKGMRKGEGIERFSADRSTVEYPPPQK
jgi:hypothetical protein